jgi:antitoxin FitA
MDLHAAADAAWRRDEIAKCLQQQQTAVMPSITIRAVPGETRDELAARAARTGRSLQEYLRGHLIELARRPDPEALLNRVRERKQRTGSRLPAEQVLAPRDADRR